MNDLLLFLLFVLLLLLFLLLLFIFYVLLGKHFVYTAARHVRRYQVGPLTRQICDSTAHSVPSCPVVSRRVASHDLPFSELPEAKFVSIRLN